MKYTIPQGATEVEILDPVFTVPPPPTNLPPIADAGSDFNISLPTNTIKLVGRGSDPEGAAISFLWTKVSGGAATIVSPNSANTDVTGLVQGNYVFRLTVTDDKGLTKTDDVAGIVNAAPIVVPSTYEGYGRDAKGGEGKQIYEIRSKSDFENRLGSNRILKFMNDLSFVGRYELNNISFLTIDGNGFDITLDNNNNGNGISFDDGCHHNILAWIRVINAGNDCVNVAGNSHDILFDHCSMYDGRDGNLDLSATSGKNFTIQNCFIGRNNGSGRILVTTQNGTIHHCLLAGTGTGEGSERNPFIHCNYSPVGSPNCDFRNNIVYNWGRYGSGIGYSAAGNFVNNYYATNKGGAIDPNADPSGGLSSSKPPSLYCSGNVQLGGADINKVSNHAEFIISDPYKVTMTDAKTAANSILKNVGTAKKNSYEQSVINAITIQ